MSFFGTSLPNKISTLKKCHSLVAYFASQINVFGDHHELKGHQGDDPHLSLIKEISKIRNHA